MKFFVKKHSPQYNSKENCVEVIGSSTTESGCIEVLRNHFLKCNQVLLDLSKTTDVPSCIIDLATASVKRNPDLDIIIKSDGTVFVDGVGPEMDYYTITEDPTPKRIDEDEKAYTIVVKRTREVEVIAPSFRKAQDYVKEMYLSGDACAELEDAVFAVESVRELTAEESGE